jgi:hypothetical protein
VFFGEWKSQDQLHRIQAFVIGNQIDKGCLEVEELKFDKEVMVTKFRSMVPSSKLTTSQHSKVSVEGLSN